MDNRKELLIEKIKRIETLSQEISDLAKTNRRGLLLISQKMKRVEDLIRETDLVTPEILKESSPLSFRVVTDLKSGSFKCIYSEFLQELDLYPPYRKAKEFYISELIDKGEVLVGVKLYSLKK